MCVPAAAASLFIFLFGCVSIEFESSSSHWLFHSPRLTATADVCPTFSSFYHYFHIEETKRNKKKRAKRCHVPRSQTIIIIKKNTKEMMKPKHTCMRLFAGISRQGNWSTCACMRVYFDRSWNCVRVAMQAHHCHHSGTVVVIRSSYLKSSLRTGDVNRNRPGDGAKSEEWKKKKLKSHSFSVDLLLCVCVCVYVAIRIYCILGIFSRLTMRLQLTAPWSISFAFKTSTCAIWTLLMSLSATHMRVWIRVSNAKSKCDELTSISVRVLVAT